MAAVEKHAVEVTSATGRRSCTLILHSRHWRHIASKHVACATEPWEEILDANIVGRLRGRQSFDVTDADAVLPQAAAALCSCLAEALEAPRYITSVTSDQTNSFQCRRWLVVTRASLIAILQPDGKNNLVLITAFFPNAWQIDERCSLHGIMLDEIKKYASQVRLPDGKFRWVALNHDEQRVVLRGDGNGTAVHRNIHFVSLENWGFRKYNNVWHCDCQSLKAQTDKLASATLTPRASSIFGQSLGALMPKELLERYKDHV